MHDPVIDPMAPSQSDSATATLFMWRGAGIFLIGERADGRWVLARAWLRGDRLEHVRRWSFSQPIPFSGQVRRLVMDATTDFALAQDEGLRALAWSETVS
jgi:hypothetical protein